MSTIPSIDTALEEVLNLEGLADLADKPKLVDSCKDVLDGLLEIRTHLPQQRDPSP